MTAIDAEHLSTTDLVELARRSSPVHIHPDSLQRTSACRQVLERMISRPDALYYGINTGFGDLWHVSVSPDDIEKLQRNLILSHACGTGEEVPAQINDLIQLLKIRNLTLGYSGIRTETVQLMTNLFNAGARPVIHTQGSLGASGDLAPLAHLALLLIGEGQADFHGRRMPSRDVLQTLGLQPLTLGAKEGLALLNGTQFSTAYGVWAVEQGRALLEWSDATAALSMDAFLCQSAPLDDRLHQLRCQPGQIRTAGRIRQWLNGSDLGTTKRPAVQDPYAFRCVPQVHGASRDAWTYTQGVIDREINAVTDNPTIFPEEEDILSGGNFHAQPVALALDFLAIALAELASISERRIFQLVSGKRDLPAFLVHKPGLHSGLMIAQYTAASIVSQSKQLCTPASVDSIVSSNGQEDHVSMAANAATKLYRVVENTRTVLAIEWMTAAQALDFRRPRRSSPELESLTRAYRSQVPFLDEDRIISEDIHRTIAFLKDHDAQVLV